MSEKIKMSKGDAKWYRSWKKRIQNGTPLEGDYNFLVVTVDGETLYDPPADGSDPAMYINGEWKLMKDLYEEQEAENQSSDSGNVS